MLLKYSPACFSFFYESILKRDKKNILPSWSSLINEDLQFKTQVGSIQFETEILISILITNDTLIPTRKIEPINRGATYDGVITIGNNISFIIETKPDKNHVWEDQLCPSISHVTEDVKVIEYPIVLKWSSIIKYLNEFINSNIYHYTERQVANDFLSLMHSSFSHLNPYDEYSYCKKNTSLIQKRTERILKSIVKDEALVRNHTGWGYFIETPEYKSIRKIGLIYKAEAQILELSMYFGDTQGQAKAYYPTPVSIEEFHQEKWIVYGNFHLATVASNLVYFHSEPSELKNYISYWNKNGKGLKQIRNHSRLVTYIDNLVKKKLIPNNKIGLTDKILTTKIVNVNIYPGIGFIF